jgi:hypothetical protein
VIKRWSSRWSITGRPLVNLEMGGSHRPQPIDLLASSSNLKHLLCEQARGIRVTALAPGDVVRGNCRFPVRLPSAVARREWACNEPGIPERLGSGPRDATFALARMSSRSIPLGCGAVVRPVRQAHSKRKEGERWESTLSRRR